MESRKVNLKNDASKTGFYYFLKDQSERVHQIAPQMRQLEVIAFLQSKWTTLSAEDKLTYEMLASEKELIDKKVPEEDQRQSRKSSTAKELFSKRIKLNKV